MFESFLTKLNELGYRYLNKERLARQNPLRADPANDQMCFAGFNTGGIAWWIYKDKIDIVFNSSAFDKFNHSNAQEHANSLGAKYTVIRDTDRRCVRVRAIFEKNNAGSAILLFEKMYKDWSANVENIGKIGIYSNSTSDESTTHLKQRKDSNVMSKNIIYYGPPGTGKTHITKERATSIIGRSKDDFQSLMASNQIGFITFHQSYGYEEFIEGLRARSGQDGRIYYSIENGFF